ncbi:PREDICTED: DNA polymerase delta subunit 2-like isoform X1 [Polistes canadensis]|uniref:DNA polymerase delta subunit 2-like isoform X1 n=1 Tax=Polistes canadensis TaxID=91411 RepID=UPI000718D68D|nr:PREDICTED: DNA polymerase delta subunit 2-like isoform X1 [Polistes canadensis]
MEDNTMCVFIRENIPLNDFKRFLLPPKNVQCQYSSIYLTRLNALRDNVILKAKIKWATHKIINISDLVEFEENKLCVITGTLYKHEELKRSALQMLATELQVCPQPLQSNYESFKDILFLEDEALRIKLTGNHMNVQSIVTGIVSALLGRRQKNGTFWVLQVEDWCFPGYFPTPPTSSISLQKNTMTLLVSGLSLANNVDPFGLTLLSEWIIGMAGTSCIQKEAARIAHVIIAGNSIRGFIEKFNHISYSKQKKYNEILTKETKVATHRLDEFLKPIVKCCCVTLMPGEFDPTCHMLPQQPLHPCLLPQTIRYKSFHCATNPWVGSIGSRIIAGSSGQPIQDIMKVDNILNNTPLEWLENTLYWRHYAPTGSNSLPSYPYFQNDPFIIKECLDIYFVGNMEKYETKVICDEGHVVRLVCIPNFSKTRTAVLLDLENLETFPISFEANL